MKHLIWLCAVAGIGCSGSDAGDGTGSGGAADGSGGAESGSGGAPTASGGSNSASGGSASGGSGVSCKGSFHEERIVFENETRVTSPSLTGDALELYLVVGESSNETFQMARRSAVEEPFGAAQSLPELDSFCDSTLNKTLDISFDGLRIYFSCYADLDFETTLYLSTRADRAASFGEPIELGLAPASAAASADELAVYGSLYTVDTQTRRYARSDIQAQLGSAEVVPGLEMVSFFSPVVSSDGLEIYGAVGETKTFSKATRTSADLPFGAPQPLSLGAGLLGVGAPDLSADCRRLVYSGVDLEENWAIYEAER